MRLVVGILFLLSFQVSFAQTQLPALLDTLAQTNSPKEKTRLGMKVAAHLANEDWERALTYIDMAKKNAISANSPKVLADYHISLAEIYSAKDALDVALKHLLTAYDFYETQPDSIRSKLENDLAVAFARTANEQKALDYFRKVYRYQKTKPDTLGNISILNNIGRVWMGKNVDSSLFYFQKALDKMNDFHHPRLRVLLNANLAKCYVIKNKPDIARTYFKKALSEFNATSAPLDEAWVHTELAEFYLAQNQTDSAIVHARKAVDALDSLAPYGFTQHKAVGILYESYMEREEYKDAANYFDKYLVISDSINLEDKKVNVERLLIEEEHRNMEKIRELEENKRRANNYILFLTLSVALLILGGLLYRYHNKLKRTELEKELGVAKQKELASNLQLKNKELIGKAMIEVHRAEIIGDILNDLKQVKLKAVKKETQSAIDYIAKRLERDTASDIWDEFEIRFEQVHESFYKNLIAAHPNLTPREKRLCALLKLNLTSKEIAQIMGQTPKSIENARTRLRKKLNITNSQIDLSAYLSIFG